MTKQLKAAKQTEGDFEKRLTVLEAGADTGPCLKLKTEPAVLKKPSRSRSVSLVE